MLARLERGARPLAAVLSRPQVRPLLRTPMAAFSSSASAAFSSSSSAAFSSSSSAAFSSSSSAAFSQSSPQFSSRLPKKEDVKEISKEIHGELDISQVKSKAMRSKLLKEQKEKEAREKANEPPSALSNWFQSSAPAQPQAPPPPQYDFRPMTLGESMKAHFVSGVMVTIGFIAVLLLVKVVFGEGSPETEKDGTKRKEKQEAYLDEMDKERGAQMKAAELR